MDLTDLSALFVSELQDLHRAEVQILEELPPIVAGTEDETLRSNLRSHLKETHAHVRRLEQILDTLQAPPRREECAAMKALLEHARATLMTQAGAVRDTAIVAALQRIEHYEIAGYGTAVGHAHRVGDDRILRLLLDTLEEERVAERRLSARASQTSRLPSVDA